MSTRAALFLRTQSSRVRAANKTFTLLLYCCFFHQERAFHFFLLALMEEIMSITYQFCTPCSPTSESHRMFRRNVFLFLQVLCMPVWHAAVAVWRPPMPCTTCPSGSHQCLKPSQPPSMYFFNQNLHYADNNIARLIVYLNLRFKIGWI